MAKIKLGARPKTFRHIIKVALPEGESGTIEMVYRYKTQSEAAEYFNGIFAAAKVRISSMQDDEQLVDLAAALSATRDDAVEQIMAIADGWNLDDEFSRVNVARLCDELPGAAMAIIAHYRDAVLQGRLGN